MNKLLAALLLLAALPGCPAFDPALLNPMAETLPVRLPTLTPEVQSERIAFTLSLGAVPAYVRTLFEREVLTMLHGLP